MGSGGEAKPDDEVSAHHRYDLRRRSSSPANITKTQRQQKERSTPWMRKVTPTGKPLRRKSSLEKLTTLADWKNIGLHKKYADETRVRLRGEGEGRERGAAVAG